jgi:hypothetical protein
MALPYAFDLTEKELSLAAFDSKPPSVARICISGKHLIAISFTPRHRRKRGRIRQFSSQQKKVCIVVQSARTVPGSATSLDDQLRSSCNALPVE